MTDAFIVALNAEVFQDFLSFFACTFLFGTVNPAVCHTEVGSRVHHIAHHQAAVIDIGRHFLVGEHNQQLRRTIEWVDIHAHNISVQFRKLISECLVRHRDNDRRLLSHTCCSVGTKARHKIGERQHHLRACGHGGNIRRGSELPDHHQIHRAVHRL